MNRRFVLLAALLLALLVAGTLVLWPRGTADAESPPLAGATIGGPFNLVDQNGQPYGDRNLKGHYALVYFGYSYCPDVCPTDLARMMQGLKLFEASDVDRAAKVQPVFITIDPARDTLPVVKPFVSDFLPRPIGLTGNQAAVAQARKSYRIYARQTGPEGAGDYYRKHHP